MRHARNVKRKTIKNPLTRFPPQMARIRITPFFGSIFTELIFRSFRYLYLQHVMTHTE